ncbi:DUF2868 domain-containing protein [Marinobacter halodurans]|uniref:DUF2868 domain-containing protein n=1 Tax=Marinobacter halodurans TaxID=2528979 RepID=A0ABY1ZFJ7_9GAMM|nr:DUF2868 domain-containing protein [Marinobacter halodurans]TBW49814.1 DUF2868 domain-containing protein [Marinobacter halodurans]
MRQHPVTLLLAFDDQVRRDQAQSAMFLHRRDRRYALNCQGAGRQPSVAGWLRHIQPHRAPGQGNDRRLRTWRRLSGWLLPVGAVLGILTMLGLLFYDGSQQINITVIIGFVALQGLLALATTVQALVGWRPWGRLLSPRRAAGDAPTALDALQPQLAACTAQQMALAFTLFAWLTLMTLVVVQDLAFGWSTTLRTSADSYTALVQALAAPWQHLWPAAYPSLELVTQTQFYRLGDTAINEPARYGDWWPFVSMLWLTYAVLPRLLLALFARLHLRWQARRLLRQHPGRRALRHRFDTPVVESVAAADDSHREAVSQPGSALHNLPPGQALIRWAGTATNSEPAIRGLLAQPDAPVFNAGGTASLAEDQQVIQSLAGHHDPVILLTRAWEPPTGELADFLHDARRAWSKERLIALLPVGGESPLAPASPLQLAQWQRFAERQQDGNLWVCRLPDNTQGVRRHG